MQNSSYFTAYTGVGGQCLDYVRGPYMLTSTCSTFNWILFAQRNVEKAVGGAEK